MKQFLTDNELLSELQRRFKEHAQQNAELQNLTNQLLQLNRRLEESEALKSHFISNITNELINPFASILALSTEILESKQQDCEQVRFFISLIHTESFFLDFQLRNIFAAANIEAGQAGLDVSLTQIPELVSGIVDLFKIEAAKRRIVFKIECEDDLLQEKIPYFKTDAAKFKLILANLLSNAVKFNKDEGIITIKLRQQAGNLWMSVSDDGIGIPHESHHIIFDRFKRLDNTINSVVRGQGLGLSIVSAYLDLLNGEINVDSDRGRGSNFIVWIPECATETTIVGDGTEFIFDSEFSF